LILISILIVIFFIDLKHYIIPDVLTIIIGSIALIKNFLVPLFYSTPLSPANYLLSALGALLFFLFLVVITKGRGMGLGDVKFAFVMGLLLGYPGVVISLYIAFLTGAVVSVILILRGRKRFGQTIPFGPFLVFGTLIVLLQIVPQSVVAFIMPYLYW
jgi:prepilin signal peptidase PulO-like enzyme (type II secretory pathway)